MTDITVQDMAILFGAETLLGIIFMAGSLIVYTAMDVVERRRSHYGRIEVLREYYVTYMKTEVDWHEFAKAASWVPIVHGVAWCLLVTFLIGVHAIVT